MNINEIAGYAPLLTDAQFGSEPCIYELIEAYYIQGGHTTKEASELTNQYLRAIATKFEMGV